MQSVLLACTSVTSKSPRFLAIAYHSHVFLHNLQLHSTTHLIPPASKPFPSDSSAPSPPCSPSSDPLDDPDDPDNPSADPPADDTDKKEPPNHPPPPPTSHASPTPPHPPTHYHRGRPRTTQQLLSAQQRVNAVRVLQFSPDGDLLLTAGDAKSAHVYVTSTASPLSSFPIQKKASAGAFIPHTSTPNPSSSSSSTPSSSTTATAASSASTPYCVLIADKTGDCWQVELTNPSHTLPLPPLVTMGHLSVITGLAHMGGSRGYLLTSDSDGKIRISHHPRHYDIQSFALSPHFISAFTVVEVEGGGGWVVSGGLGGRVTAWDALTGARVKEVLAFPDALYISSLYYDPVSHCIIVAAYPLPTLAVLAWPHLMLREPFALSGGGEGEGSGPVAALAGDGGGTVWVVTEGLRVHSFSHVEGKWERDGVEVGGLEKAMEGVKEEGRGEGDIPVWSTAYTVYHRLKEKERRAKEAKERAQQKAARQHKHQQTMHQHQQKKLKLQK